MPHAIETLSFDIFGLTRRLFCRMADTRQDEALGDARKRKTEAPEDAALASRCSDSQIYFSGMFPVL